MLDVLIDYFFTLFLAVFFDNFDILDFFQLCCEHGIIANFLPDGEKFCNVTF